MKKFLLAFAVAVLILPALSGGVTASPAHQNSSAPILVTLGGPSLVANASTSQYYLNLTGGPSGVNSFNYSYSAVIHAANVSGSSITPSTGSGHTGVFPVNITSTSSTGVMTVVVNASFTSAGVTANRSQSFIIRVVHPITITVPVRNNGNEGLRNVPISMYVDGVFKQSRTVSIPARNETNVTFEWIAYTYSPGTHVVTLVIDYNGTLLFSNGARQTTINLYIPGSTFTVLDNLLTAGIVFAAIVFFMIFMRRPKPRT